MSSYERLLRVASSAVEELREVREAALDVLDYDHCDHMPSDPESCTHCRLARLIGFHGERVAKGLNARAARRENRARSQPAPERRTA